MFIMDHQGGLPLEFGCVREFNPRHPCYTLGGHSPHGPGGPSIMYLIIKQDWMGLRGQIYSGNLVLGIQVVFEVLGILVGSCLPRRHKMNLQ